MEGLEPPHLAASDPKSDVSANFTTWAFKGCKSNGFDGKKNYELTKINLPTVIQLYQLSIPVHDFFSYKSKGQQHLNIP